MGVEVRLLDHNDFNQCLAMSFIQPRFGGTDSPTNTEFVERFAKYFFKNDSYMGIGYFENNILISWIAIGMFDTRDLGVFWIISGLYTSYIKTFFTFERPDIISLLQKGFEIVESMGHTTYYYTIAERAARVYERQWIKNKVIPIGKYKLETICVVEPNEKPRVPIYWKLMGETKQPTKMIIKKRTLIQ